MQLDSYAAVICDKIMVEIRFVKGVNQGTAIRLEGDRIVLGRNADCGVVLNEPSVSREHAVIRRIGGNYFIEDLKSRNGTFVNSKEVKARTPLKDKDRIKICDNLLAFYKESLRLHPKDLAESREKVDALFGSEIEDGKVEHFLSAGWTEKECRDIRDRLTSCHVFLDNADTYTFQAIISDSRSPIRAILAEGFYRVIMFDAQKGVRSSGAFDLRVFNAYLVSVLGDAYHLSWDPETAHEEDIAQCLKDEERSLFCFLNVDVIPVKDLRRLRGFTQGRHQVLFLCRAKRDLVAEEEDIDEQSDDSSVIEATLATSRQSIFSTQPSDKLAMLIELGQELSQTFNLDQLLHKVIDCLFNVFRQADRAFIILSEEGGLITKLTKTRRDEGSEVRFSRKIVNLCLETGQSLLWEDASSGKMIELTASIADCKIRSVMCVPLTSRNTNKAFGVIQLDTLDRFKKFSEDDLKLLLSVAGQAALAIESANMHETIVARAGLERDLKFAQQVQKSFLPKSMPRVPGYEFHAHYESAQEVGGDYYDFIPLPNSRLGIMIGDVAGKGVSAALFMAKVSAEARFCALTEPKLDAAISRLNVLLQETGMVDRFVTLGACLIDPLTHAVACVNAGHLPPLVFRKAKQKFEEPLARDAIGFPLGVVDGFTYKMATFQLEPGDTVMLFTDGVTELRSQEEVEFSMDGVRKALGTGPMSPKPMVERLVGALRQHAIGRKPHDDMTIVSFRRKTTSKRRTKNV